MSTTAGIAPVTLARLESGAAGDPRLSTVVRLLATAGLRLTVCDRDDELMTPQPQAFTKYRDLAGRRMPAHLDVEDVRGDIYRPRWVPVRSGYSFRRNRRFRDEVRDIRRQRQDGERA